MTSVKVAVRIRPISQRETDGNAEIVVSLTDKIILTNNKISEYGSEGDVAREATRTKEFSFNYIFWSVDQDDPRYCSQEKIFQQFGADIVSSAYDGYNACAFAYGQPGSGKTYTMIGTKDNRGLIPRICEDMFLKMSDTSATYRAEISFMEIYNERVRDLLETSEDRGREGLRVREHPKFGPYVEDLSRHVADDISDVQQLIRIGEMNRCTAPTNMNDVSSRSHVIFTLTFTQARMFNGIPYETQSKIHLVDLAGSESADASGATGLRLKEGGNINRSLVTLGTVIALLAKSSETDIEKKVFIPYRDSKLTWLLKDSLGGNSRTFMIATISPADINYNETLRTLRYAVGAKNILNKPTKNEDPSVRLIRELKEEITRLKAMLGGGLDKVTEPRVKEMLQESEVRVKVLTEEWTEKWHETDIPDHEMAVRKDGMGIMLDSAHPHLIGIDDDIFSTGITLYKLKIHNTIQSSKYEHMCQDVDRGNKWDYSIEFKMNTSKLLRIHSRNMKKMPLVDKKQAGMTTIGRNDSQVEQDIKIAGLDIEREHCNIYCEDGVVQLIPKDAAMCTVNGAIVTEPTQLTQGAVILLGKTNMFRFNYPAEAVKMKEELKNHGISQSRQSSIGYGRSLSEMYRSTDSLMSATWETSQDYGEEMDKLNDQRKEIDLLERRFDKAQIERETEISDLERDVHDILASLEGKKDQLRKDNRQTALYEQSIKRLTEEYENKKKTIMKELTQLNVELEASLKSFEDELLLLEERENDLVISQITLQTNVHSKIDNLLQSKCRNTKVVEESRNRLQTLQESLEEEIKQVKVASRVNEDILNNLVGEEEKIQTDLELKFTLFEETRDKVESRMTSEIKRIEEAWQDIAEHEKQIKDQSTEKLDPQQKANLRQRQTHLNEAKALLLQEQETVSKNHKELEEQLENDQKTLEKETWKEKEEFQLKKQNVLLTLSPRLSTIDQDVYDTQKCIIEKEKDMLDNENELENLEGMLNISTESCTKQQNIIEIQTQEKKAKRDIDEDRRKASIVMLQDRLSLLDKEFKEKIENIRQDIFSCPPGTADETKLESKIKNEKEVVRLQELYDNKHSVLLNMKQHAEEQQDKEFESLEVEIMKLEEMQSQARIDQEVKRRLRDVRLNKANGRRFYESFASLETEPSVDGASLSSTTLQSMSGIGVNVVSFCLKNCGSDSFYEFEINMLIGKDYWTVYRRYSKFREMHKELRRRIPEMRRIQFPPKKIFTKSEKVLEQRRKQLEIYLQNVLEIFIKTPWCPLHPLQNKDLNMKLLCNFEPFFKRGLFERSSSQPEK